MKSKEKKADVPIGDRPERRGERGIALLVVMTMVVMFTAFVMDFGYTSRMKYIMASHARDAAKAEALAVSGIRIYQMLLLFGDAAQGRMSAAIPAQFRGLLGSGSMVVRMIPCLDTGLLRILGGSATLEFGEDLSVPGPLSGGAAKGPTKVEDPGFVERGSFLDFEGDFMTCAKEESSKISLNGLVKAGKLDAPAAQLLLQTLKKEQYQPLFRNSSLLPEELVANIIDWGDLNSERADGRGYEDNLYNNLDDPYNAKNAPFDSISELHLVAGMNDDLYAVIAPMVSAFTISDKVSLPISDSLILDAVILAANPNRRFTDTDMLQIWSNYQRLSYATLGALPPDVNNLLTILQDSDNRLRSLTSEALGEFVQASGSKNLPKVFTLTSTGSVGEVERTVEVVVNIKENWPFGGQIRYWREE